MKGFPFKRNAAIALLVLGLAPGVSQAWFTGPPDGRAGDPPANLTCKDIGCHNTFPLNGGDGNLSIQGLPAAYSPDGVYELRVVLNDPDQLRWGFEATVIQPASGNQAGVLAPDDTMLVQVSEGAGNLRDYIKHKEPGTFAGQEDGASWTILWTAPPAGTGTAHFYLAGNAANNNGFPTNDFIYTFNRAVPEANPADVGDALADQIRLQAAPNPTSTGATIRFQLPRAGSASLAVIDLAGREVRRLDVASMEAGAQSLYWDGRDDEGRALPGGVYYYVLTAGVVRETQRLIVVR